MADRGRPKATLELSDDKRATLQRWARKPKSLQALALRSRIVLTCAEGLPNTVVAQQLGVNKGTVGKWRARFVEHRLEGLSDEPRPGAPRTVTDEQVEAVIVKALESRPAHATHWSTRSMAEAVACASGGSNASGPSAIQAVGRLGSKPAFRNAVGQSCLRSMGTALRSAA